MYRACIVAADTQHSRIYLFDRTIGESTQLAAQGVLPPVPQRTHVVHREADRPQAQCLRDNEGGVQVAREPSPEPPPSAGTPSALLVVMTAVHPFVAS